MKKRILLAIPAALVFLALLGGPAIGSAQAHPSTFPDVAENDPAHVAIEDLVQQGIISGSLDGRFFPDDSVTRAQTARMLVKSRGLSASSTQTSFTDLERADIPYVEAALGQGWMSGFPDGTFHPDDALSRQQMAAVLIRALKLGDDALALGTTRVDAILAVFADEGEIEDNARPYVAAAVLKGLVSGSGGLLSPSTSVTRAQFCVALDRANLMMGTGLPAQPPVVAGASVAPAPDELDATEQATASFLDSYVFGPRNSPITGEMVIQNVHWYGIPVISQLVIMAAETSLGDPRQGGTLARHYNFGCMRYHGADTAWGALSDGKIWAAGKDWYSFPSAQAGMEAFGRYLKTGVNGFYLPILGAEHPDWARFAGVYYGRGVPGLSSYISRLHTLENSFRSLAAKHDVQL